MTPPTLPETASTSSVPPTPDPVPAPTNRVVQVGTTTALFVLAAVNDACTAFMDAFFGPYLHTRREGVHPQSLNFAQLLPHVQKSLPLVTPSHGSPTNDQATTPLQTQPPPVQAHSPPEWTLPQLRFLLAIALQVGRLERDDALVVVSWIQRRNAVAAHCHRQRRLAAAASRPASLAA